LIIDGGGGGGGGSGIILTGFNSADFHV
jgi:hypothetical protein